MAIQSNFPAIKPSLLLDFANTKQLDPRITFTRATTATYYDGVTTAMAEQNLFTYSQEFDNAVWTYTNATLTANTTTAPDGTSTADSLIETATTGEHRLFRAFQYVGDFVSPFTVSVFVKANTRSIAYLFNGSGSAGAVFFNLSTGTIGSNTYPSNITNAVITSAGNGWYRISALFTNGGGGGRQISFGLTSTDGVISYAGDGTSSIYGWGFQLEQRSAVTAYTATTTQAITNYIPVLQTAASGVARFDNNPTTGESLGLLIEESRTNLNLQSADFTTTWTTTNATVSANTVVAPDGTLTGDSIINTTTSAQHYALQNVSIAANGTYTTSVYLKALGTTTVATIWLLNAATADRAVVNFTFATGAVSSSSAGGTPFTSVSATATSVGNGWSRVTLTATSTGGAINLQTRIFPNDASTFTGDGYSGVFAWGGQLEAGAFATSYIPTVASTVTRNADSASMTGTNFSSWYNFIEGALYTEASTVSSTSTDGNPIAMASIQDGTANNRLQNRFGGLVYSPRFVANGLSLLATTGVTTPINTFNKAIITYKSVNASSTYSSISAGNGAIIQSTSSAFSPASVNALLIGNGNTSAPLNGTVKKVAYYPIAVTSAQLQALTS